MGSRGNGEEFLLQPEGRLDLRGGSRLQQQFETIALRRYKLWVIDMSCIEFIDSFGLASLVAGLNAATQVNARLVLCSLRPSAQLIFEITQLDQVFTIFESHEAMLSGLGVSAMPTLPTLEVA